MKLKAEIELGKRTAALPKTDNRHGNQFAVADVDRIATKQKVLDEMGINRKQASNYERMARHENYVDQYIDRKLALNQTPTRHEVMREIQLQI